MIRIVSRRNEAPQQRGDEGMLQRVYQQGFSACERGLPRRPPAGYDGLIGMDLVGIWAAGWDQAHEELVGYG